MNRVDIHFHILPAVDDGPGTIEESIELAQGAAREGTGTIVATPHVRPDVLTDVSELGDRVAELRERLAREGVDIDVRVGAELGHMMVGRLRQSDLERIAVGPRAGRWLLLETPFGGLDDDFTAAADELRDRGFGVVVAHPERAVGAYGPSDPGLRHELERGSLLQVNAWSLAGRHGGEAREIAERLLAAAPRVVVASDAHGGWRLPALDLGVRHARAAGMNADAAERLVRATPRRLLEKGIAAQLLAGA